MDTELKRLISRQAAKERLRRANSSLKTGQAQQQLEDGQAVYSREVTKKREKSSLDNGRVIPFRFV